MGSKSIEIMGGPNGSGKTTFAESYLLRTRGELVFLNPDLIASGIAPLDFDKASFHAGRVLLSEVKSRIRAGQTFAFESTLSGRTWSQILQDAKNNGYKIRIYFLFLKSVRTNISRINKRVKLGGHNIPTNVVIRRQPRCFDNFWTIYRPMADDWYIFDNSGKSPTLVNSKFTFDNLASQDRHKFEQQFLSGGLYGK